MNYTKRDNMIKQERNKNFLKIILTATTVFIIVFAFAHFFVLKNRHISKKVENSLQNTANGQKEQKTQALNEKEGQPGQNIESDERSAKEGEQNSSQSVENNSKELTIQKDLVNDIPNLEKKTSESSDDSSTYNELAMAYAQKGEKQKALDTINKGLEKYPNDFSLIQTKDIIEYALPNL